jgi:nicotinic acid mononucleotide adenylyltransferase
MRELPRVANPGSSSGLTGQQRFLGTMDKWENGQVRKHEKKKKKAILIFFSQMDSHLILPTKEWLRSHSSSDSTPKTTDGLPTQFQVSVLLTTGAMNPIHFSHISMLLRAKQEVEKHNVWVAGAFLSPSHDDYVASKLGPGFIPSNHRIKMINLAIQDSKQGSYIQCYDWEVKQHEFWDFPSVTDQLHKELNTPTYISHLLQQSYLDDDYRPSISVRVLYTCGGDHFLKCCGAWRRQPVVCVERPGSETAHKMITHQFGGGLDTKGERRIFLAMDYENKTGGENISSTQIRKRLEVGLPLDGLTFSSVVRYLEDHFRKKFDKVSQLQG